MLEILEYMKNSRYDEVIFTCTDHKGFIDVYVDYREQSDNSLYSDYLGKAFYNVDSMIRYCYDHQEEL